MTEMTDRAYREIDAINWSRLKSMRTSPLQYRYDLEHERADSVALRIGRAVHALVLEPDRFHAMFAIWEGTRRGKAWDTFSAANAHMSILTEAEMHRAHGCAEALLSHPVASAHLHGAAERVIQWTDPITEMRCKARVDQINGKLQEIKTAADISPSRWPAQCVRYGYLGQLAWYADGIELSGHGYDGTERRDPVMLVVQSEPPHDVAVWTVPEHTLELGRREYRRLLDRLHACKQSGRWPGVCDSDPLTLHAPAWAEDAVSDEDDAPLIIGGEAVAL